jgi:hypothetical protein
MISPFPDPSLANTDVGLIVGKQVREDGLQDGAGLLRTYAMEKIAAYAGAETQPWQQ